MLKYIFVFTALMMVSGCTGNGSSENNNNEEPLQVNQSNEESDMEEEGQEKDTQEDKDPIAEQIETISLEDKVSQMMYVGVQGTSLSEHERSMIQEEHMGGLFLLEENIETGQQLRTFTSDILKANQKEDIPLFMGVDEEGGRVSRIPDSIKNFPSNAVIGKAENTELSKDIGALLAKKVKAFGFNMNFAPVLDVNNNPNNPVIGDRSFGADPALVSDLGTAAMQGIQAEHVVPVIKHFPGHGDTSVDSHINLPEVDKSLETMEEFELVPFRNAIEEGADMVMVAHILYPQIDDQYPSSLSKDVITGLLRDDLNFDGVVITDDMTMGAITENYGMAEAAVLSIQAGTDMFMMYQAMDGNYTEVKDAVLQAVEDGEIDENRINESVERILRLKKDYGLENKKPAQIEKETLNQEIAEVLNRLP
ncbi:beta-N-acetylhexosaminidase [Salibacterium salarium]|uniref:Beta-N-acetylhexosaminidase n=1 Tax=Salibacterium salarium TaxID=284579 RepID=A0A3R9Q2C7_9BACI|nr:beta-N-acetylhexosaminidase [Salibacterium salarium]RSL32111.1 beta-N-acetylhexosaminidase [Salibacterium salarium]